jgi:ferredoxin
LKAGLAAGLRLPFSCRSGMCRTCKGRVVSGQVDFGDAHVKYLSETERAQGFALLCCASPLSDLVVEVEEIDTDRHLAPQRMPARVLSFEAPASDVRIVTLGLPANEPVQFRAGQFIDVLRPDGDRTQTRAADLVQRPGRGFLRQTGVDMGLTGRVLALSGRQHLTEDRFRHLGLVDPGPFDHRFDHARAELMRRGIREGSVETADRGARSRYDNDIGHDFVFSHG